MRTRSTNTATSGTSPIRNRSLTSRERSSAMQRQLRTIIQRQLRTILIGNALATFLVVATPVAAADAEHGKLVFQGCAACHSEAANSLGPSLKGVYCRKSAALED